MAMKALGKERAYDYHESTIRSRLSSILQIFGLGRAMLQFRRVERRMRRYG